MHIETLKIFCDLVEMASFSAAASHNFVTQSQEVKNRTLVAVQIRDDALLRPLGIIYRRGQQLSPAREKFIEFLCAR